LTPLRAFAAAVAFGVAGVLAAPAAGAQLDPLPEVTTPPVDVVVPGLGIEVHVPGQSVGGSGGVPELPGAPSAPSESPGAPSAPSESPGAPSAPSESPGAPSAPSESTAPGPSAPAGSPTSQTAGVPAPAPAASAPPERAVPSDPTAPPATPASRSGSGSGSGSGSSQAAGSNSQGRTSGGGSRTLGSAIAGAVTQPVTLVSALTLALGLGVVVGSAPYLPRYRRRQRELLEQWARAAERERAAAEKLSETDHKKSEFLALVSHELRTPLTAVKGFVDTVLLHWDGLPEERRRELLTRASSNADELGRLVSQLMEFARSDTGPVAIAPSQLGVRAAADGALRDLAPVMADHTVHVDVPDGLTVKADADAFNHVLVNLLTNAAKFSPAGSRVLVRARSDETEVVVSVTDEGVGIPREDHERIFERYYQSADGDCVRGTGIGLTIAQRFTTLHGGRIWVDSEPGRGSTFSFTMPAANADGEVAVAAAAQSA
jgi:signal transduction histidine kinase